MEKLARWMAVSSIGKVGRKSVAVNYVFESVVNNAAASFGICADCLAYCYIHLASFATNRAVRETRGVIRQFRIEQLCRITNSSSLSMASGPLSELAASPTWLVPNFLN